MTLVLDPDIRDWVVLPLFIIMVITGLLRYTVSLLFTNAKVPIPFYYQRGQYLLKHITRLTRSSAAHYIPTTRWYIRKQYTVELLQKEIEFYEAEKERLEKEDAEDGDDGNDSGDGNKKKKKTTAAADPMSEMMANPMKMMGGNMFFMVQNMVMMQGIQHFFSGFILLQIPFPLTVGFKNMFQKGVIEMPDLAASYVSSVSWYFLVMYGLCSFLKLMIGIPVMEQNEQDSMAEKVGYQNPPPPQKTQDVDSIIKLLKQEIDTIELNVQPHKSEFDNIEKRLLGKNRYPKKPMNDTNSILNDQASFLLGGTTTTSTKSSSSKKKQ